MTRKKTKMRMTMKMATSRMRTTKTTRNNLVDPNSESFNFNYGSNMSTEAAKETVPDKPAEKQEATPPDVLEKLEKESAAVDPSTIPEEVKERVTSRKEVRKAVDELFDL